MTNYRLSNLLAQHRRARSTGRPPVKAIVDRKLIVVSDAGQHRLRMRETHHLLVLHPTKGWRARGKRSAVRDITRDEARQIPRFIRSRYGIAA